MIRQRGLIPPLLDEDGRAWWEGLAAGRIVVPRCRACGRRWFPPGPSCPWCGARDFEQVEAARSGVVYSFIVVHRPLDPAFAEDPPYAIGTVDLDGGPRVLGRLADDGSRAVGARVQAEFYEVERQPLLGFGAVREEESS